MFDKNMLTKICRGFAIDDGTCVYVSVYMNDSVRYICPSMHQSLSSQIFVKVSVRKNNNTQN